MTLGRRLSLILFAGTLLSVVPVWADEVTQRLESIVLDTFDSESERTWVENGVEKKETRIWVVRGSKFTVEGFPKMAFPEAWPTALFDTNPDNLPLKVLGINGGFDRLGYNYVEFFPATKDAEGTVVSQPLRIPGVGKSIDIWVWGSMFRYNLEVHIRDSRGIPYVLELGNLWFRGWRNLSVRIPTHIPQSQIYLPNYLGLTLTKFVVRTDPGEKVDNFFVYFDNLKVLSDMHSSPFDGRDLARPEVTNRIWSSN